MNIPSINSNTQRRHRHRMTGPDTGLKHAMDLYTMRPFSFCTGRKLSTMGFPVLNHICLVMYTICGTQTYKNSGEEGRSLHMLMLKTLVICPIVYEICYSPSMRTNSKPWSPRPINVCGPFRSECFMSKLFCLLRLHPTHWENIGTITSF